MENVSGFLKEDWNVAVFRPGRDKPVTMNIDKEVSLKLMQTAVNGYICHLFTGDVGGQILQMWVNDEGGVNGMEKNMAAGGFLNSIGLGVQSRRCCGKCVHGPLLVLRGVAKAQ